MIPLLQNPTKFIKKLRGNFITQILCLFDFFAGFVVISLQVINSPPVVIGLREPWVYVKCTLVIRKRLIILAFISVGISPIVVSLRNPRGYFKGLVVIRDSLVIFAFTPVGNSPIIIGFSIS